MCCLTKHYGVRRMKIIVNGRRTGKLEQENLILLVIIETRLISRKKQLINETFVREVLSKTRG